jgi:hypothetical protein
MYHSMIRALQNWLPVWLGQAFSNPASGTHLGILSFGQLNKRFWLSGNSSAGSVHLDSSILVRQAITVHLEDLQARLVSEENCPGVGIPKA